MAHSKSVRLIPRFGRTADPIRAATTPSRNPIQSDELESQLKILSEPAWTILVLSANPRGTARLRLDEEVREIRKVLERSIQRDRLRLETRVAIGEQEIRRAVLDLRPTIVHFCCHGEGKDGLVLEGEGGEPKRVDSAALEGFFEIFSSHVRCVILNACQSEAQAEAIARQVDFVVGMKASIDDESALKYAVAFYDSLGADLEVPKAHAVGCNAIKWASSTTGLVPQLHIRENASKKLSEGQDVSEGVHEKPSELEQTHPPKASQIREWRQVALLCCDVRAEDPEESCHALSNLRELLQSMVGPCDGSLVDEPGDRLVVSFGYPLAHEDNASRVGNLAIQLLARIPRFMSPEQSDSIKIRIGIHVGRAIILSQRNSGRLHLGITLDQVIAVTSRAQPGGLTASSEIWPQVSDLFNLVESVEAPCSGDSLLVAHRLLVNRSRCSPKISFPEARCLGRETELSLILSRWELAGEGLCQIIHVFGEAGIGKTCLVGALHATLKSEVPQWLIVEGKEDARPSPFFPLPCLLEQVFNLECDMNADERLRIILIHLKDLGLSVDDILPSLATILDLPDICCAPVSLENPDRAKRRVLAALVSLLSAFFRRRPTVWIIDDLHWVDPSTRQLIEWLIHEQISASLLLVLAFRSDFEPSWGKEKRILQLNLTQLPRMAALDLIAQISVDRSLPEMTVEQIAERAEGIPLFIEQITRMVLEDPHSGFLSSAGALLDPSESFEIPATLRSLVAARLDRLHLAKNIAQLASVIGTEFSFRLLMEVASIPAESLEEELSWLINSDILRRQGFGSRTRFMFKHALIRDAVYDSILKRDRIDIHEKIAKILQRCFSESVEGRPESLARHYTRAGVGKEACSWWISAGVEALKHAHCMEAIQHFSAGLEVLSAISQSTFRDRQELILQTNLASSLKFVDGPASSRTEVAYSRALELSGRLGEDSQKPVILWGLWAYNMTSGALQRAFEIAREMVDLAKDSDCTRSRMQAFQASGIAFLYLGDISSAENDLETTIELAAEASDQMDLKEIEIHSMTELGICTWLTGRPDTALKFARRAVRLSEMFEPIHLPYSLLFSGWLAFFRRDAGEAKRLACRGFLLSKAQRTPHLLPYITQLLGLAEELENAPVTVEGIPSDIWGIDRADSIFSELKRSSTQRLNHTRFAACLCEAHLKRGNLEHARSRLADGWAALHSTGEVYFEAELFRLEGELVAAEGRPIEEFETLLRQGIARAHEQSSSSLELRSCLSLGRHLESNGRGQEGRELVSGVYERFDEGHATSDLREAKCMIEGSVDS